MRLKASSSSNCNFNKYLHMQSSYRDACCCSVLSNCYQNKLLHSIKKGSDLTFHNLFHMKADEEVEGLLKSLTYQWSKEKKRPPPSLLRALCRSFGCSFITISLFVVLFGNSRLWHLRCQPSILHWSKSTSTLSTTSTKVCLYQFSFYVWFSYYAFSTSSFNRFLPSKLSSSA